MNEYITVAKPIYFKASNEAQYYRRLHSSKHSFHNELFQHFHSFQERRLSRFVDSKFAILHEIKEPTV